MISSTGSAASSPLRAPSSAEVFSGSAYSSSEVTSMFFRALSADEETEFRRWAREHYQPGSEIPGHWHPVVVEECARIQRERAVFVADAADEEPGR